MKKLVLIITLVFISFCFAKAQDDNAAKAAEKIEALKIAFITKELGLSAEEAQKFWPVYNQYETEIKSLYRDNKTDDVIENDERLLNVRKKYRPEFEKVLGQPRMKKLFMAEKNFRKALIDHLKNRNKQAPSPLRRH